MADNTQPQGPPAEIVGLPGADDPQLRGLGIPPHSEAAEQSVLGGLLLSNEAWDSVAERIIAADFYRTGHQVIFRHVAKLLEAGEPLDVVTLSDALNSSGELESAGGMAYLMELARNTPSASNVRAYAKVVGERSVLRKLIRAGQEIAGSAFNPDGRGSHELIDEAERRIMQVSEQGPSAGGPQEVGPLLGRAMQRIEEIWNSGSSITGLGTGYSKLDSMTSGLQRADMIVVAGRPSMGKTSFAMNMVEHAALGQQRPVLVFSMEMPAEQLIVRLLSGMARIGQDRIRRGELEGEEWQRISEAAVKLKDRPLYIDDTPALTPTEVRARARRLAREHGALAMIVVDYLQLMRVAGASEGRTAEISEISRNLKALAKELDCPLVAVSQLNRAVEQRPSKRPVNSDLRDSGAIEQDADVILLIYRAEVYNENSEWKGTAEVIVGKQRNGPIGMCRLTFIDNLTRFEPYAAQGDA